MTRRVAVLRPEPGNRATVERVAAAGGIPVSLPLFDVRPLAWDPPDPEDFDALLLTSANALRHGGAALERYRKLPVHAVGAATAAAARAAGFCIAATGPGSVAALVGGRQLGRLLHIGGRERTPLDHPATVIAVYASEPAPLDRAALRDCVALVHSRRAAQRLAELRPDRTRVDVVAISAAAAEPLGSGWRSLRVASRPDDAAMVALALAD